MTIESRTGLQPSRQASFLPLLIIEWCLSSCVTLILPTCKYTRKLLKNRKTRDGLCDCNKSWFGFCNPTLQQGFCFSGWKSNGEQPVSECSGLNCWVQHTNMKLCRVFLSLKFITTFLKKMENVLLISNILSFRQLSAYNAFVHIVPGVVVAIMEIVTSLFFPCLYGKKSSVSCSGKK